MLAGPVHPRSEPLIEFLLIYEKLARAESYNGQCRGGI